MSAIDYYAVVVLDGARRHNITPRLTASTAIFDEVADAIERLTSAIRAFHGSRPLIARSSHHRATLTILND
jgi:hypothetical protein